MVNSDGVRTISNPLPVKVGPKAGRIAETAADGISRGFGAYLRAILAGETELSALRAGVKAEERR